MRLLLQGLAGCAGARGGWLSARMALALLVIAIGLPGGLGRCLAVARWLELHTRAAGFGEAYGNGLFSGSCSMLAFSDMVHFFTHKFSGLRAGRFSFPGIFTGAFKSFIFRHSDLLCQPNAGAVE